MLGLTPKTPNFESPRLKIVRRPKGSRSGGGGGLEKLKPYNFNYIIFVYTLLMF